MPLARGRWARRDSRAGKQSREPGRSANSLDCAANVLPRAFIGELAGESLQTSRLGSSGHCARKSSRNTVPLHRCTSTTGSLAIDAIESESENSGTKPSIRGLRCTYWRRHDRACLRARGRVFTQRWASAPSGRDHLCRFDANYGDLRRLPCGGAALSLVRNGAFRVARGLKPAGSLSSMENFNDVTFLATEVILSSAART